MWQDSKFGSVLIWNLKSPSWCIKFKLFSWSFIFSLPNCGTLSLSYYRFSSALVRVGWGSQENGWVGGKGGTFHGLPTWCSGKESTYQCRRCKRRGFDPWVRKIPWNRKWQPTPELLPGESHGERSLAGYSPRGRRELDMTAHIHIPGFRNLTTSGSFLPVPGNFTTWTYSVPCGSLLLFQSRDHLSFIYTMLLVLAHVSTTLVSHSPFACLFCKGGRFPNGLEMVSERKWYIRGKGKSCGLNNWRNTESTIWGSKDCR